MKVEARFPAAPLSSPPPPSFVHRRAPLPPPSPPPRRHRCATIAAPPPLPPPCYHHHETAIAAFIATALVAPPLPRRLCRATIIAAVIATMGKALPRRQLTGCIGRAKKGKMSVFRRCMGLSHLAVGFRHYLQRGIALVGSASHSAATMFTLICIQLARCVQYRSIFTRLTLAVVVQQ